MTGTPHIRYTEPGDDGVARITLDRPDARNALSAAMCAELVAAFDRADDDPAVRAVLLTGAGSAFCAGGDLKRMREQSGMFAGDSATLRRRYTAIIQQIPRRLDRFDKPVVAAVNGAAIGAGCDLSCMCDVRIAGRRAKWGSTFVKVGLIPGDGGAYILGRTVGFPRALEMILTGRIVGADEAAVMGLCHRVVDDDVLLDEAHAAAVAIAALPPVAVQLAKRAAYEAYDMSLEQALEMAATYQGITQRTDDHREAVAAMLERRSPVFRGE